MGRLFLQLQIRFPNVKACVKMAKLARLNVKVSQLSVEVCKLSVELSQLSVEVQVGY